MKTKKWFTAILACALLSSMFTISGCSFFGSDEAGNNTEIEARKGASRAAKAVMEAIDSIGEKVTLQSEEAIVNAEALYAALSDADKADVVNYEVLTAARTALDQLKMQSFAAKYLIAAKAAFIQPESVVLNHVYVLESPELPGTYYFTYDLNTVNMLGNEEQRFYSNSGSIPISDESIAQVGEAAFAGVIGNIFWMNMDNVSSQGRELNVEAIQAEYAASF